MSRICITHGEVSTGVFAKNLKERDYTGNTNRSWEDNIKMDVTEIRCVSGFIWLMTGIAGELL
jgi:hypothetical protein